MCSSLSPGAGRFFLSGLIAEKPGGGPHFWLEGHRGIKVTGAGVRIIVAVS